MEPSSSLKTFIEKLKTNRQTQITTASIVLLVVVIIGGIIFAKVTNDKKRGISEDGTMGNQADESKYSLEFPN